ncbi:MAG: hypothetical protein ACYCUG_09840 [Acidimicrobiales bacterium]
MVVVGLGAIIRHTAGAARVGLLSPGLLMPVLTGLPAAALLAAAIVSTRRDT